MIQEARKQYHCIPPISRLTRDPAYPHVTLCPRGGSATSRPSASPRHRRAARPCSSPGEEVEPRCVTRMYVGMYGDVRSGWERDII